jgi:hypothetical protein
VIGRGRVVFILTLASAAALVLSGGMDAAAAREPGTPLSRSAATSAVVITATVGSATVSAAGVPPGRVRVVLLAADGAVLGGAETTVQPWRMAFEVELYDSFDKAVIPRSGESLAVEMSGGITTFTLPELMLEVDRRGDIVHGRTGPQSVVRAALGDEERREERVTQTADGTFTLAFAPEVDVVGDVPLLIDVTTAAGHHLLSHRRVPFVRASLVPGDISGAASPMAELAIRLVGPDGRLRGQSRTVAGPDGRFIAWARDADGWRVRPAPGDRIRVDDGAAELELVVPPLTSEWDLDANRLGGAGHPGAGIELVVWNPWYPGESDEPVTVVGPAGAWSIEPAVALHPGTHTYATERLEDGDQAYFCVQIPMLHIQPGSAVVEIETLYDVAATLELWRDGRPIARASGGGLAVGILQVSLRDEQGREVATAAGDRLRARLDGHDQEIAVGALATAIDAATGRLTGLAPPGTMVGLAAPGPLAETATADAAGRFALELGERVSRGWPVPAARFAAFYRTSTGHNLRSAYLGPVLNADLGAHRVSGRAMPGAAVEVARHRPGAAAPELTTGRADSTGVFELALDPGTPPLAAGDAVSLTVGSVTTGLTLPRLTAALDPSGVLLTGTGPPNGLLDIRAYLRRSNEPEQLTAFIAPDGRWSVNLRERVNGLGSIDPADVRVFELRSLEAANGARSVVPGPWSARAAVFLPLVGKG